MKQLSGFCIHQVGDMSITVFALWLKNLEVNVKSN